MEEIDEKEFQKFCGTLEGKKIARDFRHSWINNPGLKPYRNQRGRRGVDPRDFNIYSEFEKANLEAAYKKKCLLKKETTL